MFTQTTEYALRIVVYMAGFPGRLVTAAEIAEATKVPSHYLLKVLKLLANAQIVAALRGVRGGYSLNRAGEEISVLDIVNAVSPLTRISACPLGLPEHHVLCPLHQHLDDTVAKLEQQLAAKPITELIEVHRSALMEMS